MKKKATIVIILILLVIIVLISFINFSQKKTSLKIIENTTEEKSFSSNIIKNVSYVSEDAKGNKYTINAYQGEIDLANSDLIYLTDVIALIDLIDSENIEITSDYGKYNITNYDTIFSKNVIINYQYNKITGEYLDFSFDRESMIVSKEVVYTNLENILKADVIEVNIETKDTKIFMHESEKQVNIKSKEWYGSNKKI